MHQLGQTRSASARNHALFTPETFVRAPLPGMLGATAIVHTSPAMGAAFTQYSAEFDAGGQLGPSAAQRFVYVLEGQLSVQVNGRRHTLPPGGYAYLPDGSEPVAALAAARAVVIEKPYWPLAGTEPPEAFAGAENSVPVEPLGGDPWLTVRKLLPDRPSFDFAVNTMHYLPGATLPMVEIHVMEHGLLMLEGGGIYRLDDRWYPVTAGDFIWMGPYCPQWFGALGKTPAKYIIYKDWNRHPLATSRTAQVTE
jgi:(S)-ureidoglycine aminohydrolase